MKKLDAIRQRGCAIAFDDVGGGSAALPLLDVVAPEVIKLDMRLVRSGPGAYASQVMPAVLKYRERTEAVIVAEGVETTTQYKRALAWGATLGQGHRFGRPVPLSTSPLTMWSDFEIPAYQRVEAPRTRDSPFNVLFSAGAKPHRHFCQRFKPWLATSGSSLPVRKTLPSSWWWCPTTICFASLTLRCCGCARRLRQYPSLRSTVTAFRRNSAQSEYTQFRLHRPTRWRMSCLFSHSAPTRLPLSQSKASSASP